MQLHSTLAGTLEALCYVNRSYCIVVTDTELKIYQFRRTLSHMVSVTRETHCFTGTTGGTDIQATKAQRAHAWRHIFIRLLMVMNDVMIEQKEAADLSLYHMSRENCFIYMPHEILIENEEKNPNPLHFYQPFYRPSDRLPNPKHVNTVPFETVCCHLWAEKGPEGKNRAENRKRWRDDGYGAMDG